MSKQVVYINKSKDGGLKQGKVTKPEFEGKKEPLNQEEREFVESMKGSKR